MQRTVFTLNLPGMPIYMTWGSVIAYAILVAALFGVMTIVEDVPAGEALIGALVGLALHLLACTLHQAGHAVAAQRTGYPMQGWRTYWLFGTSLYPADEGNLPAAVHIQRALGGQIFSLPLTLIAIIVAIIVLPAEGMARVLTVFFLIDALTFSPGAFIPLPLIMETDGNTLLRWWPKRRLSASQNV